MFRIVQGNVGPAGGSGLLGVMPNFGRLRKAAEGCRGVMKPAVGMLESWPYFELRRMKMQAPIVDLAVEVL